MIHTCMMYLFMIKNKGTCDGANAPPQVPSTYSLFLAPAHLERRPISGAGPSLAPAVPS